MSVTLEVKGQIVGRMLQIVSGLSGLPAVVVEQYRQMVSDQGYELPETDTIPEPKNRKPCGSCGKKKQHK